MTIGLTNVHVDMGSDKISDKTRVDRAGVVGAMAPKTPLYQKDAGFKDSVDTLVQAGADLDDAEKQVAQLEAELSVARAAQEARRNAYDKAYGLCTAGVEKHSTTPGDIQSYGFVVLAKNVQGLVAPMNIEVKFDPAKGAIRVHVTYVSGKHQCAIEVSTNPADPNSWKRIDGTGVTQTLTGYPPGTWWVRAATLRAKERSDWFGPVAVVVK